MDKKLLVVDDSVFILEEIRLMLKDTEFKINGYAKNGENAIGLYEELQPDLVAMDIVLPYMDGFEATKAILAKWPEAKIIMVSSLAYDETVAEARNVGAVGFIFKPFTAAQLLDVLRNAVK